MKKLLLFAICILFTTVGFSQGDQKFWLSGKVGFSTSSDDTDSKNKVTMGYFSPSVGYWLNEKIAVGIGLEYEGSKLEEDNPGGTEEIKISDFSVMPFARYYKIICERFALYGQLGVGFGSGKEEFTYMNVSTEDTYSFFKVAVTPGVQFWICETWSFSASVGALKYKSYNDKGDFPGQDDVKSTEFKAGLDFKRARLGVNWHF